MASLTLSSESQPMDDLYLREEFSDLILDLCEARQHIEESQVLWKVEYLTQDLRHYQYYGINRSGQASTAGHEMTDRDGINPSSDPQHMLQVMSCFLDNARLARYTGTAVSAETAFIEFDEISEGNVEVTRISIEKSSRTFEGRKLVRVTNMIYLGLPSDAPEICRAIAEMPEVSLYWCKERHFLSALPPSSNPLESLKSR